jgi:hypothetical protein
MAMNTKTMNKVMHGTTVITAMKAKGITPAVMKHDALFTKFSIDKNQLPS